MPRTHTPRPLALAVASLALALALTPSALNAQGPGKLARQVEIRRTAYGIPHIRAENLRALGYGMGWVQMEDHGRTVPDTLLLRRGRVVSKEQLVNHLYGWADEVGDNAIEVNVYRLRKKLEPLGCEIRTVRGMGYLMDPIEP